MVSSVGHNLNSPIRERHPVLSSHNSVLVLDFFLGKVRPRVRVLQVTEFLSQSSPQSFLSPELRTRMRKVWGESWPGHILERGGEELGGEEHGEDHELGLWDQTEGQPGKHSDQSAVIKPEQQSESVLESVLEPVLTGNYIFN